MTAGIASQWSCQRIRLILLHSEHVCSRCQLITTCKQVLSVGQAGKGLTYSKWAFSAGHTVVSGSVLWLCLAWLICRWCGEAVTVVLWLYLELFASQFYPCCWGNVDMQIWSGVCMVCNVRSGIRASPSRWAGEAETGRMGHQVMIMMITLVLIKITIMLSSVS